MKQSRLEALLRKFDAQFDTSYEDQANRARGEFLKAFPIKQLSKLTLDQYVIGTKRPTFCAFVEPKTRLWANIISATALKFGVYYGHTRNDPEDMYRHAFKYGDSVEEAFDTVKNALLDLINDGRARRFGAIDGNPLSPLFRAKILSLYFPNDYLNVCNPEHLTVISKKLDLPSDVFASKQQNQLVGFARNNPIMRRWSNPKVMTFLYNTFIRPDEPLHTRREKNRRHAIIDMDDMLERRKRIGEMSERFALDWEKERLIGLGYKPTRVEDRRNAPSCGYDFLSGSSTEERRFIEVKTAGQNHLDGGFRFFLSETQHEISKRADHRDRYYFYLVFYKDGLPYEVRSWRAADFYKIAKFDSNGYVVSFDHES